MNAKDHIGLDLVQNINVIIKIIKLLKDINLSETIAKFNKCGGNCNKRLNKR